MAIANLPNISSFNNLMSSKDGDFKKIINKEIEKSVMHEDANYSYNVLKAKCQMDFYEDMNMEAAHG